MCNIESIIIYCQNGLKIQDRIIYTIPCIPSSSILLLVVQTIEWWSIYYKRHGQCIYKSFSIYIYLHLTLGQQKFTFSLLAYYIDYLHRCLEYWLAPRAWLNATPIFEVTWVTIVYKSQLSYAELSSLLHYVNTKHLLVFEVQANYWAKWVLPRQLQIDHSYLEQNRGAREAMQLWVLALEIREANSGAKWKELWLQG